MPTAKQKYCVAKKLKQRILAYENEFLGILYGFNAGDKTYILNCSGKEQKDGGDDEKEMEIISEVLPCGVDPIGVLVIKKSDESDNDVIQSLISQLPDTVLDVSDPIVFTRKNGEDALNGFVNSEGSLNEIDLEVVDDDEIAADTITVRIRGQLKIVCAQTEAELSNAFKHLVDKVACPYGTFRLEKSDVFFLHQWKPKKRQTAGWSGGDILEDDAEFCEVTNVNNAEEATVDSLWKHIQEEEEDDGFGSAEVKGKKKVVKGETMNFRLLLRMSGDACTERTLNCAPVIHYDSREVQTVKIPLAIDSLGMVPNSMKVSDLMEILKGCVHRQIHEMARSVLSEFKMKKSVSIPEVYHFKPEPFCHYGTIVYTKTPTCAKFAEFRKHLHGIFLIPVDRPYFRRMNKYIFEDELPKSGPLMNVHVGLKSGSTGGKASLVQGNYTYHHYLQDGFDDDQWGCAYRSLQTLISWFRFQGYVATDIPTHKQIQKCLVDIGDKEPSFIGSKQWIGSTEVGFVLETSCNIQSKFLSVSSGEELASKGRELATHFETQGTPIMIGGGVLAHTILGVEWNEETGDIRWLILDPHYTGADWIDGKSNLGHIQGKGWVGWKGPGFWKKDAFYNMCMPQRPISW